MLNRLISKKNESVTAMLVLLVSLFVSVNSHAISDCAIGLMESATVPTINGEDGGAEWGDGATAILDSADVTSCLDPLRDYEDITDTYPHRHVTVKSKRYQRAGTWYVGFLFTVPDSTQVGDCGLDTLCVGETMVIQFNPNINGDDNLVVGEDKRIVFNHKWQTAGADPTLIMGVTVNTESAVSDELCPATNERQFGPPSASGITYEFRKDAVGGGYIAEFEVPVSFIKPSGVLTEDIGIAFAIINEFGKDSFAGTPDYDCGAGGSCEAAGAGFPNDLPIINGENPIEAECELGWTIPRQWGVGYLREPPGSYSISRLPEFWRSNAITVFECDSPGYTYYPDQPCRARIQADITNTGAVATKKVVFLWAKHGTGDPAEYNFVDIQDVVLESGTVATPVETTKLSDLWDDVPSGEANHPCLRVYIFPDSLTPADQAILEGTSTGGVISRAQLNTLVANYGVDVNHWAQKNISRHATQTVCPNAGCRITSSDSFRDLFRGNGLLISSAYAQTDNPITTHRVSDNGNGDDGDNGEGDDNGEGGPLDGTFVTDDLVQFAKNNVMVQVSTVAYKLLPGGVKPQYSLIQDFGGIVQVFPVGMVQENPTLPLEFLVSNFSDDTMRIKLLTDLYKPGGSPEVKVDVGEQVITLQPRSEVTVKGNLVNLELDDNNNGACPWPGFLCDLSIMHILLIIILLIIVAVVIKKLRPNP